MGDFAIDYRITGSGWAEASVRDAEGGVTVTASYLSDALRSLVDAASLLCEGLGESRCSWDEEPGEFRWIFRRVDHDVELRILRFDELWGGQPDQAGVEVFASRQPAATVVRAVLRAADAVLHRMSEDEYERAWHEHPYPRAAVERLRAGLGAVKEEMKLLTCIEHVRVRPEMYFTVGRPTPVDLVVELLVDSLYEASYEPAMEIEVEFESGRATILDTGRGLDSTPLNGRPRIEMLLAAMCVPGLDERGAVNHVTALCSRVEVNSTNADDEQHAVIERGEVSGDVSVQPRTSDMTGTSLAITPDWSYFGSHDWPTALPDLGRLATAVAGERGWWSERLLDRVSVIDSRV